jgi:Na+/H+ antiporter NhaD/arsenite permease-like protein
VVSAGLLAAGGAWTPIGDVTTTMLWINGQLSTLPTIRDLLLPSFASLVVPMMLMSRFAPEIAAMPEGKAAGGALPGAAGNGTAALEAAQQQMQLQLQEQLLPAQPRNRGSLVLATGAGALLAVPVFHQLTGLPPFLGMLSGLGVMWLLTDALHYGEDRRYPTVSQVGSTVVWCCISCAAPMS